MSKPVPYYVYDLSGRIVQIGACVDANVDKQAWDESMTAAEGEVNPLVCYVDLTDSANPAIADKVSVTHTVTGNVITLPGDELQVEVTGPITDIFDIPAGETELTFTADVPGQYTLTLYGVKYLPTEVQLAI